MTARLVLVCHASTSAVRASVFPADEPIEPRGREQAMALRSSLPRADRCFTSPELRCRQTANALGLVADVQPVLHECDYGSWRGRGYDEMAAAEPEAVAAWLRDPAAAPHGGEALQGLLDRVGAWLAAQNAPQRRTLVVTHASIIRAAIVHALEALPQSFWRIDVAPLAVARLNGDGRRWNVSALAA
jgi:broad specificity phosphatase PhoE